MSVTRYNFILYTNKAFLKIWVLISSRVECEEDEGLVYFWSQEVLFGF